MDDSILKEAQAMAECHPSKDARVFALGVIQYIDELEAENKALIEAQAETFKAAYHLGHEHTVEGCFYWCEEGGEDVYKDWLTEKDDE